MYGNAIPKAIPLKYLNGGMHFSMARWTFMGSLVEDSLYRRPSAWEVGGPFSP
jgi:hypothetical protein